MLSNTYPGSPVGDPGYRVRSTEDTGTQARKRACFRVSGVREQGPEPRALFLGGLVDGAGVDDTVVSSGGWWGTRGWYPRVPWGGVVRYPYHPGWQYTHLPSAAQSAARLVDAHDRTIIII